MLDSECHLRLNSYQVGDLVCAVRSKVDACYREDEELGSARLAGTQRPYEATPSPNPAAGSDLAAHEPPPSSETGSRFLRRGVVSPGLLTAELKITPLEHPDQHLIPELFHIFAKRAPGLWFGRPDYLELATCAPRSLKKQ